VGRYRYAPRGQVQRRCLVIAARTATTSHRRRKPRPGCHHHGPPTLQPRHPQAPAARPALGNRRRHPQRPRPALAAATRGTVAVVQATAGFPGRADSQGVTRARFHDHELVLDHGTPDACPPARSSVNTRQTMITALQAAATQPTAVPARPENAQPPAPQHAQDDREPLQPPASERTGCHVTCLDQNSPSFAKSSY
jgi:hypothetical protein